MDALLVLPIVIPLATAGVGMVLRHRPRPQRAVGLGGAALLLIAAAGLLGSVHHAGVQATAVGGWAAPFGIVLVADHLAAVLTLMSALLGLTGAAYAAGTLDARRQRAWFFPLLHLMLTGVCGALLTGDVFNLFVWFELLLLASFALLALGSERRQLEGALMYAVPSLIGSTLLLSGVALLYRLTGTLNLADLARRLPEVQDLSQVTLVASLFLAAFALKAAAFPLFFWLPASYPAPPIAVTAIFSGLLTKVAIYALLRLFSLLFVHDPPFTHTILLAVGACTMVTGVLGAVAQDDAQRLLTFHVISQLGYMLVGVGLLTADALAATLFFVVHIMVTKTALFMVIGVAGRARGSYRLGRLGGLYQERPALALLFLLPALSLAGIPPFSGFLAKLALVAAALELRQFTLAAVALAVGLLTLYSMTKVWAKAFWAPGQQTPPGPPARPEAGWLELVPAALLASLAVLLGLAGGPVFELMAAAGDELTDPAAYLAAALRAGR